MPTLPLLAGDLRFFASSPAQNLAQNLNFSYSQYGFWGILARI